MCNVRAKEAFGVILDLAQNSELTPELAHERAVSAWAFVQGQATLRTDEALFAAAEQNQELEYFRVILR